MTSASSTRSRISVDIVGSRRRATPSATADVYLLDTDVLSEIVRASPNVHVMARLFAQRSADLYASEITRFELRRGASLRQDAEHLWARLRRDVLPIVRWLDLTAPISERGGEVSAELRRKGREAGTLDPLLAATALVHGLVLVTRNLRDFEHVAGLRIENWFPDD